MISHLVCLLQLQSDGKLDCAHRMHCLGRTVDETDHTNTARSHQAEVGPWTIGNPDTEVECAVVADEAAHMVASHRSALLERP